MNPCILNAKFISISYTDLLFVIWLKRWKRTTVFILNETEKPFKWLKTFNTYVKRSWKYDEWKSLLWIFCQMKQNICGDDKWSVISNIHRFYRWLVLVLLIFDFAFFSLVCGYFTWFFFFSYLDRFGFLKLLHYPNISCALIIIYTKIH